MRIHILKIKKISNSNSNIWPVKKNFLWAFLGQKLEFSKKIFFTKNRPNIRKPNIRGFTVYEFNVLVESSIIEFKKKKRKKKVD